MSAKWPTSVATDADLYVAVNSLQTTLSTALGTGDTSIVLASATGFPVAGGVTIGNEVIFYTGVSGATLTGCTRGADGTTAASHSVGVPVGAAIIAFHHNGLMAEIEAIESSLNLTANRAVATNSSGRVVAATTTDTELGYVHGVTSAIQTQMDLKAALAGPTFTGTVTIPTPFTIGAVSMTATGTELNYVAGVTSAIQTQFTGKAATDLSNIASVSADVPLNSHKLTGLSAGAAAGDSIRYEQLSRLWSYRRPVLQFVSVTTVDVEVNDPAASSTSRTILFPDGTTRTVTSSTLYRFDITRNCALSGTKQSGLRASLSEATNTWYALYAVKATDNTTDWVTVGDTVLPLVANYATLNSNFGASGWVYLGLVRNGDNSGATGDLLNFVQSGHVTTFLNACANAGTRTAPGTALASTTNAATLSYAYAAGTGTTQIPNNITVGIVHAAVDMGSTGSGQFTDSGAAYTFGEFYSANNASHHAVVPVGGGFKLSQPAGSNAAIFLAGFFDTALGVGSNPLV